MSDTTPTGQLPEIYALIWRSRERDETFDQSEFESRIPRLMTWLKDLQQRGKLVACGGGGFEHHAGGLTLIRADDIDEAKQLAAGTPMNEIGSTEILVWDVFYGDLVARENVAKLG